MTEPPEILIAQVACWVPILPCPPGEKSAGGLCHLEEQTSRVGIQLEVHISLGATQVMELLAPWLSAGWDVKESIQLPT